MPRKSATPSLSEQDAAPGGVAAVDRALSLLAVFRAGEEPLSLAALAQRSALHKSTVLRLLASLEHAMLIERLADGRYALGRGIVRLHHVHQASSSLERVVMPALRDLVAKTGESATLHALWGHDAQGRPSHRVSLFRVDSSQAVRDHYSAGDLLPLNAGTGAIILIAYGADFIPAGAQFDAKTLALARRQGYCAGAGLRHPEMAGIAAPVFRAQSGHAGQAVLVGALVLTMPASRYTAAHIPGVVAMAQRVSAELGADSAVSPHTT